MLALTDHRGHSRYWGGIGGTRTGLFINRTRCLTSRNLI